MPETDPLAEIRARADAATPGPWLWHGHMPPHGSVDLVSGVGGMPYVMGFERLGTRRAQPTFATGRNMERPAWESGFMRRAIELARTDGRCHRPLLGIDNPDAEFIAHVRADVDVLLSEVDRLRDTLRMALERPTVENLERAAAVLGDCDIGEVQV